MIIGTAGHIDHGKSALVKALTGIETDRLKEEKERGMSIDLGFAWMDLPGGSRAGIIDVPGHRNFVRNMAAGVHGIDMVLLVVAADDGPMPQTLEHLDIIDLLGISKGICVITKTDMVNGSRVDEVRDQLHGLLEKTGLKDVPIVAVSSISGEGIPELTEKIEGMADEAGVAKGGGYFRMPVDRAFTVKGFGTVATGTVISGSIAEGDSVKLFPGGKIYRVRRLESYSDIKSSIRGGERGALNISGIEKSSLRRGHLLASPSLKRETARFDARIRGGIFGKKKIRPGEMVHVHIGTAAVTAKIFADSANNLDSEDDIFASLVLSSPLNIMRGDRFIIRDYSARNTIGGGLVLNPFPPKLRKEEREAYLKIWGEDNTEHILKDILKRTGGPERISILSENLNVIEEILSDIIEACSDFRLMGDEVILTDTLRELESEIVNTVALFHKEAPSASGMDVETLRQKLKTGLSPKLLREVVEKILSSGRLEKHGDAVRMKGRGVVLSPEESRARNQMMVLLKEKGFQTASEAELAGGEGRKKKVLQNMARDGEVIQLSKENFITSEAMEDAKKQMLDHFTEKDTLTVIEFKNILKTGRKGAILLLEYFDSNHITVRQGDERVLLKKSQEDQ